MQSNEVARTEKTRSQALKHAPTLPQELKQKAQTESQDAQKIELLREVMEARLGRLKNYKLTGDSKLWYTDYASRAKEVEVFLESIKSNRNIEAIKIASSKLSLPEG